jgi:hypothetical protein
MSRRATVVLAAGIVLLALAAVGAQFLPVPLTAWRAGASPTSSPSGSPATPSATASPAPTPRPKPTATVTGWPGPADTGVPAGTKLTTVDGDVKVTQAGTVIDAKDIRGCVFIAADNVTVRRSRITCTGAFGVRTFDGNHDFTGARIEDTEINCANQGFTGIAFAHYTAVRVNIHGCENGIAFGAHATIQDSYIHDLSDADGEHPDGVQFSEGTSDIIIEHNTIVAPVTNSAIIMYDEDGEQDHDILIDDNYLAGGGWTLYCPRQATVNIRVTNNHFGPAHFGATASCGPGHVASFTGNIDATTGKALSAG